jgi:phage shock protein C
VNPRRLYRSRHGRQLAGVAAGMAEYLELDPTLVRILWVLSAFAGGFTIVLYVILAFVIPLEPATGPGSWRPAGPAWGAPPTQDTGTEPTAEAPGSVQDPGAGSPPDGWAANPGWPANQGWPAPQPDQRRHIRRDGMAGLYVGVLLVVFGAIAMADSVIPGWAGTGHLGPAMLLALGAVLLVGSLRRAADSR